MSIENKEETQIEIQRNELRTILGGSKVYSIRRGHRSFAKNLRVSTGGDILSCITNAYTHTILSEVPFVILEAEGFRNFQEALDTLRIFYPEMKVDSEVTIVEFRLAI